MKMLEMVGNRKVLKTEHILCLSTDRFESDADMGID